MRIRIVYSFLRYEIKRGIARKKVLAIWAFAILLETVPYFVLSSSGLTIIPRQAYPYIWVAGVFAPLTLFIPFMGIIIAAGAMSEEYEQGTAELLLSKPVSRAEYFLGKFLGGYLLLVSTIALSTVLSILAAYATFGVQTGIEVLPGIILVVAYSSLVFYSIAFMLGELIRRSSLSYILSSAIFFSSQIIGVYLSIIYQLTGKDLYRSVHILLPTAAVDSIPLQYALPRLPSDVQLIFRFLGGGSIVEPTLEFSALIIGTYFLVASFVALSYFWYADVSRRVS
jgi:ABC-2 type transport system permease protein